MLSIMPAHSALESPFERQLLVQLGERLRRARIARDVTAVELAERLGISRTTLRAVESGDPSPTIGTYLRVLGAFGLAGDMVLVGSGDGGQEQAKADTGQGVVCRAKASSMGPVSGPIDGSASAP
jgi:transcriptional regulator with XRE-family HTH domain